MSAKNPHAVALGRLGGTSGGRPCSEAKKAALKRALLARWAKVRAEKAKSDAK